MNSKIKAFATLRARDIGSVLYSFKLHSAWTVYYIISETDIAVIYVDGNVVINKKLNYIAKNRLRVGTYKVVSEVVV